MGGFELIFLKSSVIHSLLDDTLLYSKREPVLISYEKYLPNLNNVLQSKREQYWLSHGTNQQCSLLQSIFI